MKFIYIINKENRLIDLCKIGSDRYEILVMLISFKIQENLIPIKFDISKVERLINLLLNERNSKPLEIPDFNGRFSESEIFNIKKFNGEELKLCNSGFDNKIIFLINIYESLLKNEKPYYILFTNNHKEFNEWKKKDMLRTSNKTKNVANEIVKIEKIKFSFFDGVKFFENFFSYDNWLSSIDYSLWSKSFVQVNNNKLYIIKENVKVLSTFRFYNKSELELIAKKYDLIINEENGNYYAYAPNHNSRQLAISENDFLIAIYSIDGQRAPESIFIYAVFLKNDNIKNHNHQL